MKTILRFFTFLFFISFVFATQAAKIIFYNNTGKLLTIIYGDKPGNKPFELKSYESYTIETSFFKRRVPVVKDEIIDLKFKFKIGNGEFEAHKMKSFVKGSIDTKIAISGAWTKTICISGYGNNNIKDESKEDEAWEFKFNKKTFFKMVHFFKDERQNTINSNLYAGTSIDLSEENTSIRKLLDGEQLACRGERIAVKERQNKVREPQENFFNKNIEHPEDKIKFADDELPLSIAFCGSGGGVRARISTTGFIKGAIDEGLYDCAMYFSVLSGSSWMLAPWIARKKGMKIDDFIDALVKNSASSENFSKRRVIKNLVKNYFFGSPQPWGRPTSFVNPFSDELQPIIFKNVIEETSRPDELFLSSYREKSEDGLELISVFEVRAKKEKNGVITREPCCFTSWAFVSRYLGESGACLNIKAFNSKFIETEESKESGRSKKIYKVEKLSLDEKAKRVGPEPTLGLITGISGSAVTASTNVILTGVATQNIDPAYMPQPSRLDNSMLNCKFNNFMHGDIYFDGYNISEYLFLHDAGTEANIPIISLCRRPNDFAHGIKDGDAPDIIFVFDSSDISDGTIGEELLNNKMEMMKKGLPFPYIKEETITNKETGKVRRQLDSVLIDEIKKNGGFYIFDENPDKEKYKDWEIPTIIYMTIFDGAKSEKKLGDEKNQFEFYFKNLKTFNFQYDEPTSRGLIAVTEYIFKRNIEAIKFAMKKRKVLNLERDLYALEEIKKSKEPRPIDQEIKNLSIDADDLKTESEILKAKIDALVEKPNAEKGTLKAEVPDPEKKLLKAENESKLKKRQIMKTQAENTIKTNKSAIAKTLYNFNMLEVEKTALESKLNITKLELPGLESKLKVYEEELKGLGSILEAPMLKSISFKSIFKRINLISSILHLNAMKSLLKSKKDPFCSIMESSDKPLKMLVSQLKFPGESHLEELKSLLRPIKSKMKELKLYELIIKVDKLEIKRHELLSEMKKTESLIERLEPRSERLESVVRRPLTKGELPLKNAISKLINYDSELEVCVSELKKLKSELKKLKPRSKLGFIILKLYAKQPKLQLKKFELKLKELKSGPRKEILELSDKLEKVVFAKIRYREISTLIKGKKENIEKFKERITDIDRIYIQ